ncbi:MAG: CopG family transcriptional regulator [Gammaproteobacteria bacterium]|nr:CopG family transcriptional regulator [Gammaproteobacteria bacterium]
MNINAGKLSVSLPPALVLFIKEYQTAHACKSQSEVIKEALKLLRQKELENYYLAANSEIDPAYDTTTTDGLDDETW